MKRMIYKGAEAYAVENDRIRAVFTVRGSKMVSLFDKKIGREYLLQAGEKLEQGGYGDDYNAYKQCGFDEMFPTIDECFYDRFPWEGARLPDHGEVWGLDWSCGVKSGALRMEVHGVRLPYKLTKTARLAGESRLRISYRADNLSPFDMDFVWAAHAMFVLEQGSALIVPDRPKNCILTYSHFGILGKYGEYVAVRDALANDADVFMDKYYFDGAVKPGRCGVRHADGSGCTISFPTKTVPYLGLLPSRGLHIGHCAIVEPCTAAFDRPDAARRRGMESVLPGGGSRTWYLEFTLEGNV